MSFAEALKSAPAANNTIINTWRHQKRRTRLILTSLVESGYLLEHGSGLVQLMSQNNNGIMTLGVDKVDKKKEFIRRSSSMHSSSTHTRRRSRFLVPSTTMPTFSACQSTPGRLSTLGISVMSPSLSHPHPPMNPTLSMTMAALAFRLRCPSTLILRYWGLIPSCIDNCVFDDKRRMPFDAHSRIAMHTYIFNSNPSRCPLSHDTSGLVILNDSSFFLPLWLHFSSRSKRGPGIE